MYFFIKIILPALEEFYRNDVELIRLGVSEMTIQFRIAKYLSNFIEPKYNLRIDCEYNRNMYNIKKFNEDKVRPDIICHKRNSNEYNLFVIELKKEDPNTDLEKIKNYINDSTYAYKHGYCISNITENDFNVYSYPPSNRFPEGIYTFTVQRGDTSCKIKMVNPTSSPSRANP